MSKQEVELYEFLKKTVNSDNLPVMDNTLFSHVTDIYGRETFRKVLADFITNEKPAFPYKEFSPEDMIKSFRKLKGTDYSNYIQPQENIQKEVMEKYDDYKYSYAEHGLGMIDAPSTFNEVSDFFHNKTRMA